jgi:hypothetical protein
MKKTALFDMVNRKRRERSMSPPERLASAATRPVPAERATDRAWSAKAAIPAGRQRVLAKRTHVADAQQPRG